MGGRITVESVVRCSWNGWPDDRGIRTQPLTELLTRLDNTELLRSIIANANNPYWLVKELAGHAGLLEQWDAA